ncbi:hypothetical protein L6452_12415 [Arctium lappa]|uniref:Uncharacterized protein n=1 Tax=Arctium lappa TaxID=4217 RepID=A0ACB9DQX3_ARCLA|nr:hypothetical protein L6452_12415 [Arctium lappa]
MTSSFHLCLLLFMFFFHLCLLSAHNFNNVLCKDVERQALLEFKHGLIDHADRLASWVSEDKECCSWAGIICDNFTGHVRHIRLRGIDGHCHLSDYTTEKEYNQVSKQKLGGDLSPSLLHLKQLRHLDLSCNDFGGIHVPIFMGSLGNLRYLNLSSSGFGGIIPPQLGNLSELQVLSLRSFYDGYESTPMLNMRSVPQWIFSITSLVSLDLSMCNFQGANPSIIDTFRNLTSLEMLHVSGNNFMNSSFVLKGLSSAIGGNLISLDIRFCGVSSSSLVSLYNLTSLLSLDLSHNQLTKPIPKSLGNLCNLREIDLSFNNFHNISLTYLLESFFECKSPSVESLFLRSTGLSGHLPNQLGQLTHMVHLNLGENDFVGIIPDSIADLSFMRSLQLYDSFLSGPLPYSIGGLSSLEMLDLSHNRLNGSLPDSLGQLLKLDQLDLSYNRLIGTLPRSLGQLSKLNYLDLSSNLLTGVVTEAHFAKLTRLKYLNGIGNKIIFRPQLANWIPPFQLQYLYLNSWDLGPQFPLWLQLQRDLEYLDISNTNISAPVPRSFWSSFPNLTYLDMSHNHFRGALFSVPATLDMLDLSYNEFTGKLPDLSNTSGPYVLDLSNNFFTGSLHHVLCPHDQKLIKVLNLGNNNLSGVIPECWEKWPSLSSLHLESNNLFGQIPKTLGFSSELVALNLCANKLSGRLPASLMNLTNLLFLQLGRNELVGFIPTWIGTKLSSLIGLGLNESSFFGNNLCGDPLMKRCVVEVLDTNQKKEDGEDKGSDGADVGLIISIVFGFVAGFWMIVAPLIVSKSWRITYFRFLTRLTYMAYDVMHKYCCKMFPK